MQEETDIVEELERVNVLFYVNRGEVFQKGEAVGYDPANDKVVKLGTPGSMRLGTVQIYIPPEKGKPRSKPMIAVHIDNEEVFGVLK
ncbi:MAG: hypothetical protein J5727_02915 [Kiritimatiellae bacterium]|nr:hypothetical protein [Kiritimatiellia bacterium]